MTARINNLGNKKKSRAIAKLKYKSEACLIGNVQKILADYWKFRQTKVFRFNTLTSEESLLDGFKKWKSSLSLKIHRDWVSILDIKKLSPLKYRSSFQECVQTSNDIYCFPRAQIINSFQFVLNKLPVRCTVV